MSDAPRSTPRRKRAPEPLSPEQIERARQNVRETVEYALKEAVRRHPAPSAEEHQRKAPGRSRYLRTAEEMLASSRLAATRAEVEADPKRKEALLASSAALKALAEERARYSAATGEAMEIALAGEWTLREIARHLVLITRYDGATIETQAQIAALILGFESDPSEGDVLHLLREE